MLCTVRSWRDPVERDEPRGGTGRSHRGDNVHYDRGDYSSRRKRYDRNYDDDDDEDGKQLSFALKFLFTLNFIQCLLDLTQTNDRSRSQQLFQGGTIEISSTCLV